MKSINNQLHIFLQVRSTADSDHWKQSRKKSWRFGDAVYWMSRHVQVNKLDFFAFCCPLFFWQSTFKKFAIPVLFQVDWVFFRWTQVDCFRVSVVWKTNCINFTNFFRQFLTARIPGQRKKIHFLRSFLFVINQTFAWDFQLGDDTGYLEGQWVSINHYVVFHSVFVIFFNVGLAAVFPISRGRTMEQNQIFGLRTAVGCSEAEFCKFGPDRGNQVKANRENSLRKPESQNSTEYFSGLFAQLGFRHNDYKMSVFLLTKTLFSK